MVEPDSYTPVAVLSNGDYLLDGARATFNIGTVGLTAFAAKTPFIDAYEGVYTLIDPSLQTAVNITYGTNIEQLGGVRVVIGTPLNGNLGLTWYEAGLGTGIGRDNIFGADLSARIGPVGISGEYAKSDPNDQFSAYVLTNTGADISSDNFAWNANLKFMLGKLGLGAGYTVVKANYIAPGYWLREGRVVNPQNIKGVVANLSYPFGTKLSLVAEGQFLEPEDDGLAVTGRSAVEQGQFFGVGAGIIDKLTYWRAGLKYGLTATNTVDLGWEEALWKPTVGSDTRERYVNIGLGHSFNANASLKLLYQIIEFKAGGVPLFPDASYRGGEAAAQFELKF